MIRWLTRRTSAPGSIAYCATPLPTIIAVKPLHRERSIAWRTDQTGLKDDDDLQRTVCACLGELIPRLKPEYAELLARVELGGESLQAAAKSLAITPNNASVRLASSAPRPQAAA